MGGKGVAGLIKYLHPIDTKEAYKPGDKEKIEHLWYHLNYNQMEEVKEFDKKLNKEVTTFKSKKLVPIPISQKLKQLGKKIEEQRKQGLFDLFSFSEIRVLKGKMLSKLVHGLGTAHVRETSLTLHPVYGIPYIPSSSVKGVVRHWYIHAYCDGDEKKLDDWGKNIFGTQEQEGIIQFYDILLYEDLTFVKDIIAVHYKDYYRGKGAATDDQNANPLFYWTIHVKEANVYFTLAKQLQGMPPANEVIDLVAKWTACALTEFGIGSKTSLSYGLFSEVTDATKEFLKEKEEYEKQKKMLRKQQIEKQRLEEERKRKVAKLASMNPEERLVYEIEQLTGSPADLEKSKTELYHQVVNQQNRQAAEKLKAYWEKMNQWKVKKGKKQHQKVEAIKKLLE